MRNRIRFSDILGSLRWQWMAGFLIMSMVLAACGVAAAPAPTQPPSEQPYVKVDNQAVANGQVTVAEVYSVGPGWIVIHAQKDGGPGPVVGYAAVKDGENTNVVVTIDTSKATATLYAMLHTDAGVVGTYEFPGADVPVKGDASMVNPSFTVTGLPAPAPQPTPEQPYVKVDNQAVANGQVTVAEVYSVGPGWIVIHAQKDGGPGPVVGYAAVKDGENTNVVVTIDTSKATAALYAMLHTDAGVVGTYEFPGADVPVKGDASMVNPSFTVTGLPAAPAAPAASQTVAVNIANFAFDPVELTVKVGTTVVWTNKDTAPHTVTSDNGLFSSGTLKTGDQFQFTFTAAGTYPYYCQLHGGPGGAGMAAKVIVTP